MNGKIYNKTPLMYFCDYDPTKSYTIPVKSNKVLKKVVNIKTLEIFESITQAAKEYSLNRKTLNDKLIGRYKNNTDFMYLDEYMKLNPNFKND